MSMRSDRRVPGTVMAGATLMASMLAGCVVDNVESSSGRPLPPEPRRVAPAPTTSRINAISLLKGQMPADTTGNGFPNRLDVAVYLFSRPYPVPRHAEGTLTFTYYPVGSFDPVQGPAQEPLARWRFDSGVLAAAAIDDVIGPGYALALDLGSIGLSRLDAPSADLVVEFEAPGLEPVRSGSIQRVPFINY